MNFRTRLLYTYFFLLVAFAGLYSLPLRAQVTFDLPPHPAVSAITGTEYFFDDDPGPGNGTSLAGGSGSFALNVADLSNGIHILSVRTKDSAGRYSITNRSTFFKNSGTDLVAPGGQPATVTLAEYFFDTDPGIGNGTAFSFTPDTTVSAIIPVTISGLGTGMHTFFVRTRDSAGRYSLSHYRAFYKEPASIGIQAHPLRPAVTQAEYFFDSDPGLGNGIAFAFAPDTVINLATIPAALSGLPDSVHTFYVRTKDMTGRWSLTHRGTFALIDPIYLPAHAAIDSFIAFEYFFDHDPGFGNGIQVPVPVTAGLSNFPVMLNTSGLSDSMHTLYIRTVNDWSLTQAAAFQVGNPLPVSWLNFKAYRVADKVQLQWKVNAGKNNSYYDVERSGDGKHFQAIGKVPALVQSGTTDLYDYTDHQPLEELSYYRLKQVDTDNGFSYSPIVAVRFGAGQGVLAINNPAKGTLNIRGGQHLPVNSIYELISVSGKTTMRILSDGHALQSVPVGHLAAGHYLLRYIDAGNNYTLRFIKE